MDLRKKKTLRNIKNAFLELRAKKSLERITVKELTALAEISKATFYLHYNDVYDLSNQLQNAVINDILNEILPSDILSFDELHLTQPLYQAFSEHQSAINILFSDGQAVLLPANLERRIKEIVISSQPEARVDIKFNVILSFQIYGAYYAYKENCKQFGNKQVVNILDDLITQM